MCIDFLLMKMIMDYFNMESKEDKEARRSANCHTLEELLDAGNKVQYIGTRTLIMTRGKTTTHYGLKELKGENYWYPVAANTTQR